MRITRRARVVVASLIVLALFVIASINTSVDVFVGHYDWVCEDCQARLYSCPGKNNITSSEIPGTYAAHRHSWRLVHRPVRLSAWKPWHWLAMLEADPVLIQEPDPEILFRSAGPDLRYSDVAGLRSLSLDPDYEHAEAIKEYLAGSPSRPE